MRSVADNPSPRPELLAPAGDAEAMRAAVCNGADAVYFGLGDFNARRRAVNFTLDELPATLDYLHAHNVKGYVAFNTLIFADELPRAAEYAAAIARAGADAVIVQDLGLARLVHEMAPSLPLHASTQMTVTDALAARRAAALGISRVILARELSLPQIAAVAAGTSLELEVFIHGALCISYGGQCLAGRMLSERSANRGLCAQPCRLAYQLERDGQVVSVPDRPYLMSPRDLAAWDRVADLVRLGVKGFKIEGRLKNAHYVAAAVRLYRAAIDAALAGRKFAPPAQTLADLEQMFSRGSSHGWLDGCDAGLVEGRSSGNRGLRVGTLERIAADFVVVRLQAAAGNDLLKPGDGVLFDDPDRRAAAQGGRVYSVKLAGRSLQLGLGHEDVDLSRLQAGMTVWKTDDPATRKQMEQSYSRDVVVHPDPVRAVLCAQSGAPAELTLTDAGGRSVAVRSAEPLAAATRQPVSEESVREQLSRLGGTPFVLGDLRLEQPGGGPPAMMPKSVLNEMRRQAVEQLVALRRQAAQHAVVCPDALEKLRDEFVPPSSAAQRSLGVSENCTPKRQTTPLEGGTNASGGTSVWVLVRTPEQLSAVCEWKSCGRGNLTGAYLDLPPEQLPESIRQARAAGLAAGAVTLRICKPGQEALLRDLADLNADCLLVRNLSAVEFFAAHYAGRADGPALVGDFSLNVANDLAGRVLLESLDRVTPSVDLDAPAVGQLVEALGPGRVEVVLRQYVPLFHSEHCLHAAPKCGHDRANCRRGELALRLNARRLSVRMDHACRTSVFDSQPRIICPPDERPAASFVRIELLDESPEQVGAVLSDLLDG